MNAEGLALAFSFALCGAGALLGIIIPNRWNPALLASTGSLASLPISWVAASTLWSGRIFHAKLWTIRGLGTLMIGIDRVSALFLLVAAAVILATSIFSGGYLKRYIPHHNLKALNASYL
ncbi:MAG: hypothetical protein WCE87_11865, partial [Candidatus Udaeobacter sp.]